MCGRTACTLEPDILCKACSYKTPSADGLFVPVEWRESNSSNGQNTYRSCYNFCPTFYGPVLLSKKLIDPLSSVDERVIQPMMWGLVPKWFKGDTPTKHGLSTNNCRIEGILEKKMFSDPLLKGNRCVILCDGFYEWKAPKTPFKGKLVKQPYFIYAAQPAGTPIFEPEKWENNVDSLWSNEEGWKGPKPLMMAGIFDTWKSPENGASVYSYSIITMDSSPSFASIHERMPAILHNEEEIEEWLNYVKFPAALAISKLKASSNLLSHPVSTDVNSVKHQDRRLVRPIDLNQPKPLSASGKLMANWLIKASPVRSEPLPPIRPGSEAVKRHLPMDDLVEESSSKKPKEN